MKEPAVEEKQFSLKSNWKFNSFQVPVRSRRFRYVLREVIIYRIPRMSFRPETTKRSGCRLIHILGYSPLRDPTLRLFRWLPCGIVYGAEPKKIYGPFVIIIVSEERNSHFTPISIFTCKLNTSISCPQHPVFVCDALHMLTLSPYNAGHHHSRRDLIYGHFRRQ